MIISGTSQESDKNYIVSIKIFESDSSHKFAKNGIVCIFETRQCYFSGIKVIFSNYKAYLVIISTDNFGRENCINWHGRKYEFCEKNQSVDIFKSSMRASHKSTNKHIHQVFNYFLNSRCIILVINLILHDVSLFDITENHFIRCNLIYDLIWIKLNLQWSSNVIGSIDITVKN